MGPILTPNLATRVTTIKLNKACIMHNIHCIYKLKELLPHYRVVLQLFQAPSTSSKLLIKGRPVAIAVTTALLCYRKRATPSHDIRLYSWDSQVAANILALLHVNVRRLTFLEAEDYMYTQIVRSSLVINFVSKIYSTAYMKWEYWDHLYTI